MKRPLSFTIVSLTLTCLVLVMFAGCLGGQSQAVPDTTAPENSSSAGAAADALADNGESPDPLVFDPALVRGTLDNGFRYVLLENKTPENRVSMHLDVLSGSMNETDQQRGIAHFLEHMLFNGSTHFPPGELVEYFQSIGMRFGADANAHTSFFETVYDIFLPAGDRENLDQGLLVMEDYARGALLLQSEIDRERGVVLSEKRNRDSVSYRTFQKSLKFELPGSRITRRFPIGLEQVIKKADAGVFRSFYDTWYRPDNMVLVMAGDFDASQAETMIKKRFAAMAPRAEQKKIPEVSWEPHSGIKAFYHHEAEAGSTEVSINTLERVPFKADDLASFRQRAVEKVATGIFNNRLSQLVREPGSPFTDAGCFSGRYLHSVDYASLSAETRPENWKKSLVVLENRLRQALEHGFTGQELERAKADFLLELDRAVKEAETRKSSDLARQIIHRINRKRVFQSPRQRSALLKPLVESLSLEAVNKAFADIWSADHRLVEVTGNASVDSDQAGAEEEILSLFEQSRTYGVASYQSQETLSFPYLPEPEKSGEIRNVKKIEDLGIQLVSFANRVRLNLKKTDFKKGDFLFRVDFGSGRQAEPKSMPGLGMMAESVINGSGLGAMDRDQLDEALAGRNLEMRFRTNSDGFSLAGRATNGESELVFQLMRAYFLDAGYREDAFSLALQRYKQMYDQMKRKPEGVVRLKGERFLAGGDPRFGLPDYAMVEELSLEDVREWMAPVFAGSDIEISIAGDFDVQRIIAAAGKYMGSLSSRQGIVAGTSPGGGGPSFPCGKTLELTVDTKVEKAIARISFPTDDFWNIQQTRRLNILAAVFSERMRKQIREKLGVAYSPHAYNDPSRAYDGYGVFNAAVAVSPDKVESVAGEMEKIAFSLAEKGVSQRELTLALEPVKTHIRDMKETNKYWLNSVLSRCSRHGEKFQWARNMAEDYGSISKDQIDRLAREYFKEGKQAGILIRPRPVSSP